MVFGKDARLHGSTTNSYDERVAVVGQLLDRMMNIGILHNHFNRGGVTQVVLNQLRGLDAAECGEDRLQVAILYGGRREAIGQEQLAGFSSIDVSIHVVPALDYDHGTQADGQSLASELRKVLGQRGFAANDTLLHLHNHALGKNVSLPGAICHLAREGFRFLLQLHDFAEDLRPANYRRLSESLAGGGDPSPVLYPQAPQIHYAVLNERDYGILSRTQMAQDRLHRLPNAVGDFGAMPSRDSTREKLRERFGVEPETRYVVYPVRGIRRKNLGELLVWSSLGHGESVFGVTLPPLNPVELKAYRHWKQLAKELKLACVFETGAPGGLEFKENLAAADALVTTSVAEGFGMVFLESWLAGRFLVGRDLPEITADFAEAGISLRHLYAKLRVPIEWAGYKHLCDSLVTAYGQLLEDYRVASLSSWEIANRVATLLNSDEVDFAMLDFRLQTRVIRRLHEDRAARERLLALNPELQNTLFDDPHDSTIDHNAEVVRNNYSLEGCGVRLRRLYEMILDGKVSADLQPLPNADRILDAFLDLSRLHSVRFEN